MFKGLCFVCPGIALPVSQVSTARAGTRETLSLEPPARSRVAPFPFLGLRNEVRLQAATTERAMATVRAMPDALATVWAMAESADLNIREAAALRMAAMAGSATPTADVAHTPAQPAHRPPAPPPPMKRRIQLQQQCIHPACKRDAHSDVRFAADPSEPHKRFCCGACKKTFEAGTITKSSNHGPQCTSGPAGQGLNRAGAAPTEPRPEPRQSQRSAETVALGQAMALQRAELQQQQQQMAQRRAEQQQQQMAQELPTRSRSRSAVRSSSAKGLALGLPVLRILVTTLTDETTIHLDVTASDTIEIVKDMIQTELTERLTDRDMSVTGTR